MTHRNDLLCLHSPSQPNDPELGYAGQDSQQEQAVKAQGSIKLQFFELFSLFDHKSLVWRLRSFRGNLLRQNDPFQFEQLGVRQVA
jgi:hypothetical protein